VALHEVLAMAMSSHYQALLFREWSWRARRVLPEQAAISRKLIHNKNYRQRQAYFHQDLSGTEGSIYMKTTLWIVGIGILLIAVIPILVIFTNLIFISQITQIKVQFSSECTPLIEGLLVSEIPHDDPPADRETPDTGDVEAGQEMLLYEDGSIKEGRRVFDDDPGKEVIVAVNAVNRDAYVITGNEVFPYADGHKGRKIGTFPAPGFSHVDFVLPVNEKYMIVDGAMEDSPYPSERTLWQVEYDGLNKKPLTKEPYFTFDRPPKVFIFRDAGEQLLVYYTGSYSYAYGGDSSRPQYSVLRVYSAQYPEGRDIVKVGFKAGTVLDVSKVDDGYVLTTDPSLPAMAEKPRVPPRKWKISIRQAGA